MLYQLVKNCSDTEVITTINYQVQSELVVVTTKRESYNGSLLGCALSQRLNIGSARRHYNMSLEEGYIARGKQL